jgi:hypothetical protein
MAGMRWTILVVAAGVGACGYSPPAGTATDAPTYRADLDACQASVPDAVDKNNAKRGLSWFGGPVTRWSRIGDGLNACMAGKGWGHARACTAEELRGSKGVVTRTGVQCAEPGKAS